MTDAGRRRGRPPGPADRAARREQLLEAAEALVLAGSGEALSMDALAAAAGVTKPVLYDHFGSRPGLLAALAERTGDRLLAVLDAALSREDDAEQLLRGVVAAVSDVVVEQQPLFALLLAPAATGEPGRLLVGQVVGRVAGVLRDRLRAAGADAHDAVPLALALTGAVLFAVEGGRGAAPREDQVDRLTRLLWGGLQGALGQASPSTTPSSTSSPR